VPANGERKNAMAYGWTTRLLLALFLLAAVGCNSDSSTPPERKSVLKDYVVTPLDKAKGAKQLVEKQYDKRKKAWESLDK